MNIVIISTILLSLINIINSSNNNCMLRFRNNSLKFILFKDKNNIKLLKKLKNYYELYYNKSIAKISEGIYEYNALSEDQKTIIETVISLCY